MLEYPAGNANRFCATPWVVGVAGDYLPLMKRVRHDTADSTSETRIKQEWRLETGRDWDCTKADGVA